MRVSYLQCCIEEGRVTVKAMTVRTMSDRNEKNDRIKLGQCGEDFAVRLLELDGYEILDRNFRCEAGEIDSIAARCQHLVFTEVKTRRTAAFGRPSEAVDRRKQRRIKQAAACWLRERASGGYRSYSFQVVEIMVNQIDHAF